MIKVLSYNIHKGFTAGNRRFILGGIREAIREADADLVLLQEVLGHHAHWSPRAQFDFLAHELWPHVAYGRNSVYQSGHHGNAILSKYPIRRWENIDVSTNRLEKRGLLHAVIESPGRSAPIHAICVHLGLFEAERREQVKRLCRRIESHVPRSEPLVIAGDFNDWRGTAARGLYELLGMREAFRVISGAYARTFPIWLPTLRLDRVYYRGFEATRAASYSGRPWSNLSDHAALYVELTPPEATSHE